MLPKYVANIQDETVRKTFEHVFEGAQSPAYGLSAAPTATAPLLQDGEKGTYSGVYYVRQGNSILAFTPGSIISVT